MGISVFPRSPSREARPVAVGAELRHAREYWTARRKKGPETRVKERKRRELRWMSPSMSEADWRMFQVSWEDMCQFVERSSFSLVFGSEPFARSFSASDLSFYYLCSSYAISEAGIVWLASVRVSRSRHLCVCLSVRAETENLLNRNLYNLTNFKSD